ncbi:MAG: hypothetical protein ACFFF4_10815 [Candidatus Thorarchaeota archaeon]
MKNLNSEKIKNLEKELFEQKALFEKHAPFVINPSDNPAYKAAKKIFDAADKRIKEIEKELAKLRNPPAGTQIQPSQSKVKL